MRAALQRTPDRSTRFYAPDYRRRLRDAGLFRDLSPSEHVVLAALGDRANASGVAWPAIETIAEQYGLGESTVRQAIKHLARRGLLAIVRQAGRVNTYRLVFPPELSEAGGAPLESEPHPSRIWPPPPRNLAPIMTNDHSNEHDQQQHAGTPACEEVVAAASRECVESFLPCTGGGRTCNSSEEERWRMPSPTGPAWMAGTDPSPACGRGDASVGSQAKGDERKDEIVMLLTAELVERVRELGLAPAKVNRYGEERVRWVLERLEAERQRKVIGNPAGWVLRVLADTWNEPLPVRQLGLPFAEAAAAASRPPAGTRWARDTVTGKVIEVERVDDDSVKFADGSRLPARMWSDGWEWLAEHPDAGASESVDQVEPAAAGEEGEDPVRRTALALITTWMAIGTRTPAQLMAKLEARGLTLDDWEAYQAARELAVRLDGER